MFTSLFNTFKLSQVATVVQNLLELHGQGNALGRNAADIAAKLVAQTHAENPALFEGKQGKRPHKLSFAAAALAKGVVKLEEDRSAQLCLHLALGAVLLEISGKPNEYPLTASDHMLLEVAQRVYLASAA